MKPKFPEPPELISPILNMSSGPLRTYYYLIAMRNAKVSIGDKLNYGKLPKATKTPKL